MLDPRVVGLARRGLRPRLEKQLEEVRAAVGTVVAQVGAEKIARGTPGAFHATRPCVAAIAPIVEVAWTNLWRVVKTLGVSPDADELKEELRSELSEFFQPLRQMVRGKLGYVSGGSGGTVASSMHSLETEIRRVTELAEVEIDLALHETGATSVGAPMATPIFNFYSPVGAIQTGPGASAVVTQHLEGEAREALGRALRDLRDQLAAVTDTAMVDRTEIAEMATVAQGELDKPKPNGALLSSVLLGIAAGVQTVAALQPAYMALKAAAAAVGLQLP
jgi:hypothetical protein